MKSKASIVKNIKIWGFLIIFVSSLSFLIFDSVEVFMHFKTMVNSSRQNYTRQSKYRIMHEVMEVAGFIDYQKEIMEKKIRQDIKDKTDEAWNIASGLYDTNKKRAVKSAVQKMIIQALSSMRFGANGNGYCFIVSMDGKIVLSASLEDGGKSEFKSENRLSPYIIDNMIQLVKEKKEAFYQYHWKKPGRVRDTFRKTSYVKLFEPYNWIIGAGLYNEDEENEIKDDILHYISRIRYGSNNYIFVNRFNGDALVADGKVVGNVKKLWDVFDGHQRSVSRIFEKEYKLGLSKKGGYMEYSISKPGQPKNKLYPKVSYIYGEKDWRWIIGSGMYLDDMEEDLLMMKGYVISQLKKDFAFYPFVVVLNILLFIFFFKKINFRLKNDFNEFLSFFYDASVVDRPIDLEKLKFYEFQQLADNANKMLEEKVSSRDALYNEKEKLFVTIKSIGDGVITTDISGRVEMMNNISENLTGFSNEEAKGMHLTDIFNIVNAKTMEKAQNPVIKALEYGKAVGLANDTMLISKDGRHYQIADSASPIRDARGNIKGAVVIFRNMTEEYEIRDRLRQSESNLRLFFEAAVTVAFIKTDANGQDAQILEFSPGAENIFGYSRPEVLGAPISILFPERFEKRIDRAFRKMRKTKADFASEITLLRRGSKAFDAYLNASPVFDEKGEMTGVISVVMDITERKEAEHNRNIVEKLKSLGLLAGGIAHDFNNIMAGIFGNIEIAKSCMEKDDPSYAVLDKAMAAMDRAVRLSNQLLTFSSGGSPVKDSVSLQEFLNEIVQFHLSGSNIKPVFDFDEDLMEVDADKNQLEQVFLNLLNNSREAMPDGGFIHISAKNIFLSRGDVKGLLSGQYVMIVVEDEGQGVDLEVIPYIFDPYFTTKEKASGIGLTTVHSIISRHGGGIHIDPENDNGAKFVVYLPSSEKRKVPGSDAGEEDSEDIFSSGKRILVVDDEEIVLDVASAMLKMNGYYVETVMNGDDAVEAYKKAVQESSPFDCVIMDLTIPGGKGGKDIVRDILNIDNKARVIASSGYSNDAVFADHKRYGFQGTIAKPYSLEKLISAVKKVIG